MGRQEETLLEQSAIWESNDAEQRHDGFEDKSWAESIRRVLEEEKRREDQMKRPTTKTLTMEKRRQMKRWSHDIDKGTAIIFIEEEVAVGKSQDDVDKENTWHLV